MYFILNKYIMHSPSLFQTSTAQLFQKQNEKKSTNFQFFKPGNSLVSYTFVCCPATGPITWVLFISSASGACLTFGLALPSLSFHYVFTLLAHPGCLPAFSHTLPTTIACANLPLLSCVQWHTLALLELKICRKLLVWKSVRYLCCCQQS